MSYGWQHTMTEWRHSPCLMKPVTFVMLIIMLLFWLVTMIVTLPTWLLGFFVAPIMSRGTWLIEFLYPMPIARWGHLLILRWSQPKVPLEDKAANYHSRTLEQRVEVVKGRIFIHPIPQLLDNLGYLVVCLPPDPAPPTKTTAEAGDTPLGKLSVIVQYQPDVKRVPKGPIVAFLVDCGDAETVAEQVQLIRETHYPKHPSIQIQMVCSTHKHHDHTAGNEPLMAHPKFGPSIDHIVGGAVERVPGCTLPVADGDRLKLPVLGHNDMNDVAFVEVVAAPAHTRGSVVYLLRSNAKQPLDVDTPTPCFAFTGDTMFSGGGGVPFEAGSDAEIDQGAYGDSAHGAIRAGVGSHAVERCFAEILVRGTMSDSSSFPMVDPEIVQNQFLIFPGHEYTTELLSRQFAAPVNGSGNDANKWKNFPPHVFFETVSELYVAMHRRSLPQATGKVLAAAPTTLRKELAINPHLRSLARRAELVVQAIRLWDAYFCKPKGPRDEEAAVMRIRQEVAKPRDKQTPSSTTSTSRRRYKPDKTPATENSWNMDTVDAAQSVFTTIYTSDLNKMINDLARGKVSAAEAAQELEEMKTKLREPVIRRRPIPGTLPSERVVFKGLIGFALLGSRPSAMTLSDSRAMKLPPPIVRDTSCILVSKKRLIAMLGHLGFLQDNADSHNLLLMIDALWQEAHDYTSGMSMELATAGSNDSNYNAIGKGHNDEEASKGTDEGDEESVNDLVQLGTLKWILYGFPAKQPSWFSRFCMPCGMTSTEKELQKRQGPKAQKEHPVKTSRMKRRHGELVRHDVMTCNLCLNVTGCACQQDQEDDDASAAPSESDHVSLPLPASISTQIKPPAGGSMKGMSSSVRSSSTVGSDSTGSSMRSRSGTSINNSRTNTFTATSATNTNFTTTNLTGTMTGDDDSVSYVDSSCDSVVEVSTFASLLTGEMQMSIDKTEEKIRV